MLAGHKVTAFMALALALLSSPVMSVEKQAAVSLFGFDAPGVMVPIDEAFRLHIDCQGQGPVTVLFEAGLGGSSLEWKPVQEALSQDVRACIYDRAGYGWSDASPFPRTAWHIAREATLMLKSTGVDQTLILVGHSYGGYVARMLASFIESKIAGIVLVDASHEDQLQRLEKISGQPMMPRGNNFVVSPVDIPPGLPDEIRVKIQALSKSRRMLKTLHSEMTYFRQSAAQVRNSRKMVEYPVVVIRRGKDLYPGDAKGSLKTAAWQGLQEDMARISNNGSVVVAEHSGHHVHADQPELVVNVIKRLVEQMASDARPVQSMAADQ